MGLAGGVTSAKVRFDGVDAEAVGAVAHGRVLEAEAWRAALRVVLIQVKVTQLTPEGHKQQEHTCDVLLHELHFNSLHVNGTCVGGAVRGRDCVWAPPCVGGAVRHLSQLKPSTLSLQRH